MSRSSFIPSRSLEDLIPLLVTIYQHGHLVPFIGAGMSAPALSLWKSFVENLEGDAGTTGFEPNNSELRAQRATTLIRNSRGRPCFLEALRKSLRGRGTVSGTPLQTEALAAIDWPLVISTNYDDLFYSACHQSSNDKMAPQILGRSAADCKQVMSSLRSPFDRETIWHIQGFLGGQYRLLGDQHPECDALSNIGALRLQKLQDELVIGHEEYRFVTNTAVHFRRCFGEVFRSRSLLFLGSSLSEEYFLNLFGEVIELCGPSPVPHFAFTGDSVDARFLSEQMNITVCQYNSTDELPEMLKTLKLAIENPPKRTGRIARWCIEIGSSSVLEIAPQGTLPHPRDKEAVVVIARPDKDGQPEFVEEQLLGLKPKFSGTRFAPDRHVIKSEIDGLYAVAARVLETPDPTAGAAVHKAVNDLLIELSAEYTTVHVYLPSVGGSVPPVYGFMEAVRAFGEWYEKWPEMPLKLILYVGSQVLLNLTSQRIDVHELLTSPLTGFWVVVQADSELEPTRRVFHYPTCATKLCDVLDELEVPRAQDWFVTLCPTPYHDGTMPPSTTADLADKSLREIGVVFGSVLTMQRISKDAIDCTGVRATSA